VGKTGGLAAAFFAGIQRFLYGFNRFEFHRSLGWNRNRLERARIATLASCALYDRKAANAGNVDRLTVSELASHDLDQCSHYTLAGRPIFAGP